MNAIQTMKTPPFLVLLLAMLCWGTLDAAQAGPTRSRFDRAYPTITRIIQSDPLENIIEPIERTGEEELIERWIVDVPPWHHAGMGLRLPMTPMRPGMVAILPESVQRSPATDAWDDGGDEDDEPALTDYDYQEWLGALVAPNRDEIP